MALTEPLHDDSRGMMTLDENGLSHPAAGEARYANFFEVGYNAFEVLLEFGQSYANEKSRLHTRVVMSPSYAKELLRVLMQSVQDYEKDFGTIKGE
jgi:Protein of unknown function (DUF3467)